MLNRKENAIIIIFYFDIFSRKNQIKAITLIRQIKNKKQKKQSHKRLINL